MYWRFIFTSNLSSHPFGTYSKGSYKGQVNRWSGSSEVQYLNSTDTILEIISCICMGRAICSWHFWVILSQESMRISDLNTEIIGRMSLPWKISPPCLIMFNEDIQLPQWQVYISISTTNLETHQESEEINYPSSLVCVWDNYGNWCSQSQPCR